MCIQFLGRCVDCVLEISVQFSYLVPVYLIFFAGLVTFPSFIEQLRLYRSSSVHSLPGFHSRAFYRLMWKHPKASTYGDYLDKDRQTPLCRSRMTISCGPEFVSKMVFLAFAAAFMFFLFIVFTIEFTRTFIVCRSFLYVCFRTRYLVRRVSYLSFRLS